jgi:hypothetical protein
MAILAVRLTLVSILRRADGSRRQRREKQTPHLFVHRISLTYATGREPKIAADKL